MNKEELLNLVESLNMPRDEYYILGGGSLVMFYAFVATLYLENQKKDLQKNYLPD